MDKLLSYIPRYYRKSKVVLNIFSIFTDELRLLIDKIIYINNQMLISTADDLKKWEQQLGIKTDDNKTILERRAIIKAKLRGQGTSTKSQIKNICLSFVDEVEIIEHNTEAWFEINIILHGELPYKLDSLYTVIEEIKPAHLDVKVNLITINNGKLCMSAVNVALETSIIYPQEEF